MNTDADIWLAFARTFGMLFVVLGFFLLAFYLFRRISGAGAKGGHDLIQVLAVHHISPKEKLMLVNVLGESILIGVTPQSISSLAVLGEKGAALPAPRESRPGFSDLLKKTLKTPSASMGTEKTDEPGPRETRPTRDRE